MMAERTEALESDPEFSWSKFVEALNPYQTALLQNLLTDRRLQPIWKELQRCDRTPERKRLYPQGTARLLLIGVLQLRSQPLSVIPRRDAEQARTHYLNMAKLIAFDAKRLDGMLSYGRTEMTDLGIQSLIEAAGFYHDLANECAAENFFSVARDTGDGEARAFAMALSSYCREVIGRPLHHIVARIATVVLDRDITEDRVRDWSR